MEANVSDKFFDTLHFRNKITQSESEFRRASKRVFESYEDNYLQFLPKNKESRILDIGCGLGHFLYFLKERQYRNIEGIEIADYQVEFCKNIGLNVTKVKDMALFLSQNKVSYDFIVFNFVIEHIPKDKVLSVLEVIKMALKPEGKLILSTENMAKFSGIGSRYQDIAHEVGYTERSLCHVLYASGFKNITIKSSTINFRWRIKNICWVILKRLYIFALGLIYFIELGAERPKIISKDLICIAEK